MAPQPASEGSATISYSLGFEGMTKLEIVNENGAVVNTPLNEFQKRGAHSITIDTRDLPSGMYIVRMQSSGAVFAQQMVIVH